MFTLPVDVHEMLGNRFKHSRSNGIAVELYAPLSFGIIFSGDNELAVALYIELLERLCRRRARRNGKFAADRRLGRSVANHIFVGLAAEHKIERIQNYRLARARFTRKNIQVCAEFYVCALYKRNIFYRQSFKHNSNYKRYSLSLSTTAGVCSLLSTMTSTVSSPATQPIMSSICNASTNEPPL